MAKFQISGITPSVAKDEKTGLVLRRKFLCQKPVETDGMIVPPFATEVVESNGRAFAVWIETKATGKDGQVINPAEIAETRLASAKADGKQLFLECKLNAIELSDVAQGDPAKGNGHKFYQTITFQVDRNQTRGFLEVEPAGWDL